MPPVRKPKPYRVSARKVLNSVRDEAVKIKKIMDNLSIDSKQCRSYHSAFPRFTQPQLNSQQRRNSMSTDRARRCVRRLFILFVLAVPLLVTSTSSMGKQEDPLECELACQSALEECRLQCTWCGSGYLIMCQQQYFACSQACQSE